MATKSALTTTTNTSAGQSTTNDPQQSATGSTFTNQQSNQFQSSVSRDLLVSNSGVQLRSTPLTTVKLVSTGTAQTNVVPPEGRHIHPLLFGVSAVFLLAAVVLFVNASRSEKTTTK